MPQQQYQQQGQRPVMTVPASALAALPLRQRQLLQASRAAAAAGKQLAPALQAELVALYRQLQVTFSFINDTKSGQLCSASCRGFVRA